MIEFKEGDSVFSLEHDFGVVVSADEESDTIVCAFGFHQRYEVSFYSDGRAQADHNRRSLFHMRDAPTVLRHMWKLPEFRLKPAPVNVNFQSTFQRYTLKIDNSPSYEFTGVLLACVSSYREGDDRWTELYLYRTRGEKYIAHSLGCSEVEGETTRSRGAICETLDEVYAVFKYGILAKRLYELADIWPYNYVE